MDPYERAQITSNTYYDWMFRNIYHAGAGAGDRRRVPRDLQGVSAAQKSASFSLDQVIEKMTVASGGWSLKRRPMMTARAGATAMRALALLVMVVLAGCAGSLRRTAAHGVRRPSRNRNESHPGSV
jgi:hypothetical protein